MCLKGPLPSGLLGIMRGFVALQSELSSDAIMGRRFFFWTGNIREVLVTLVLAFAILQGSGWSSNWLSIDMLGYRGLFWTILDDNRLVLTTVEYIGLY